MSRQEFTNAIRREARERCGGICEGIRPDGTPCGALLKGKPVHFDHRIPWAIGRDSTLSNCQVLCVPCHDAKTRKIDIPVIAKCKRIADREAGIVRPKRMQSRPFQKAPKQHSASRPIERNNDR